MKHSTFLIGLLAAMLSLLSVQTVQAGDKLTITDASTSLNPYTLGSAAGASGYVISKIYDGIINIYDTIKTEDGKCYWVLYASVYYEEGEKTCFK